MARADQLAHPIQTLRQAGAALEAAIERCLHKTNKKAVHALRASTRRVEAQLELLALLPQLPPHKPQKRKLQRLLKRLRRAAGQVRDLDVQRDLIRSEASRKRGSSRSNPDIRKEAKALRKDLKRKREPLAQELHQLLHKHRAEFSQLIKKLFEALASVESLTLTEPDLTALVEHWYAGPTATQSTVADDTAQLHAIRKRAKLARYLAESAPASATKARRLAARFEKLQDAGGKWHDWLLLQQLSADELGSKADLPARFARHAESSLRTFRRYLR